MKKILLQQEFISLLCGAYFDFLSLYEKENIKEKSYEFSFVGKGVGQKSFRMERKVTFDFCGEKKISENFIVTLNYFERSKKLLILIKTAQSNGCFPQTKKQHSIQSSANTLKCYIKGFLRVFLPCVAADFNCENLIAPKIIKSLLFKKLFTQAEPKYFLALDIFILLYNIYYFRQKEYCCVTFSADEILFLRGFKIFRPEDRKRVALAVKLLDDNGLIISYKLKRFKWAFVMPKCEFGGWFLTSKKLLELNTKSKRFEKLLGHYVLYLIHNGIFKFEIKNLHNFLAGYCASLNPQKVRDKIENAFDCLQTFGIIKNWEYEKINEDEMEGKDWMEKYLKLNIIFDIKSRSTFTAA